MESQHQGTSQTGATRRRVSPQSRDPGPNRRARDISAKSTQSDRKCSALSPPDRTDSREGGVRQKSAPKMKSEQPAPPTWFRCQLRFRARINPIRVKLAHQDRIVVGKLSGVFLLGELDQSGRIALGKSVLEHGDAVHGGGERCL